MSVDVYIPTPFRRATNNQDRVSVEARDVRGPARRARGAVQRSQGPGAQRGRARSTTTSTST